MIQLNQQLLNWQLKTLKIVELPEEMIHEEVHRAINEFLGGLKQQGISPDMYFQNHWYNSR